MRILVTGAAGLLGSAVLAEARNRGHDVLAATRPGGGSIRWPHLSFELDVTESAEVRRRVVDAAPDAIVHCAAYTDVDRAETEPHEAMAVNLDGSRSVALAAAETRSLLLLPSTDYVFDGRKAGPYAPDDLPAPINAYGRSKKAAEDVVRKSGGRWLVVRTSWLYGPGGVNFVDRILEMGRAGEALRVVNDQVGRPTLTWSLARGLVDLLERQVHNRTLHLADRGRASWYDLAREAFRLAGIVVPLEPIAASDWGAAAQRPPNSVLDIGQAEELLGRPMPEWTDSLRRYLEARG